MKSKKVFDIIWQAGLGLIIFGLDRLVKSHILSSYTTGEVFGKIPYVADFVFVKNTGAAFSMFSDNTAILAAVSVIFIAAILLYRIIKKPDTFLEKLSIVLLLSGALGNAVDRIAYKFVVDFISIKWFEFPVFNIADMAIVLGAVAAAIFVIFFDKDGENDNG